MVLCSSGILWWPKAGLLCVSDLHLGKSDRIARRSGGLLPPYESHDTLNRLSEVIDFYEPEIVVCLGDSFDDTEAGLTLDDGLRLEIDRMQAGPKWVWIEGNHDPGPVDIGGTHLSEFTYQGITFRHIATKHAHGEISGHYHPKARVSQKRRSVTAKCFLVDDHRLIMPAFGTYTGGLHASDDVLRGLLQPTARAYLMKSKLYSVPFSAVK